MIYDTIYKPFCIKALDELYDSVAATERASQCIRDLLCSMLMGMEEQCITSADAHREVLRSLPVHWDEMKSNRSCFCCIRQTPEHVLSCRHALCEVCTRRFGEPVPGFEHRYRVQRCVLCGLGTVTKDLKPPTAGARILSIDGGGTRGVIPLEFSGLMQSAIGPACNIQDLFDLALGTSSGEMLIFPSNRLAIRLTGL